MFSGLYNYSINILITFIHFLKLGDFLIDT